MASKSQQMTNQSVEFSITELLPFNLEPEAGEKTRHFLERVIKICLNYIERENDRSQKVIDFQQPEQIMRMFDFSIPLDPLSLDQLVADCEATLLHQVKTGE